MQEIINKILRLFLQRKGHGFSPDKTLASQTEEDYIFGDGKLEERLGASPVIRPDGQWDNFIPEGEIQRFDWGDTYHCTVYGTENIIQTMQKAMYGISEEYTERYLGVLANIVKNVGGSPLTVAEMWRKNGNLRYDVLPYANLKSYEQFNSPKPMTSNYLAEGRKWLDRWNFGHDTLVDFRASSIKEALKYSPVGVGVYAWYNKSGSDVFTKPSWANDNHWVCIVGYVEGKYWKIMDSYKDGGSFIKKLDWNYPFAFGRRYHLTLKSSEEETMVQEGKKLYEQLKKKHIIITEKGGEIYEVKENYELFYEGWSTNSKWLQAVLDKGLRAEEKSKTFVGVSLDNFNKLLAACTLAGGGVVGKEEFTSQFKS